MSRVYFQTLKIPSEKPTSIFYHSKYEHSAQNNKMFIKLDNAKHDDEKNLLC